jgi:fumarate hydratase class I
MAAPEFSYEDLLPIGPDTTEYRKISSDGVSTFTAEGKEFLKVAPEAITNLTEVAIHDISHYLRAAHLQQLQNILKDPESSPNDRFVALDLLKNANISAGGVLPMCQDTGTAIVMGKKGQRVLTSEKDEASISRGSNDLHDHDP